MVTEKMIEAARDKFKELAGIQIYLPGEGTLDDFEQGRYDALVAALKAALSTDAEPVAFVCAADIKLLVNTPEGLDFSVSPKPRPELGMNMPLYATPSAPSVAVKASPEALEQFTAYFVKNYPGPDTIIYDPKWHAPKLFRAAVAALSAQVQDVAGLERLRDVTYAVQHNPNCTAEYLVRLVGKSGSIDFKNYGQAFSMVKHETGDILGFGKTIDEAIDNALVAAAPAAKLEER